MNTRSSKAVLRFNSKEIGCSVLTSTLISWYNRNAARITLSVVTGYPGLELKDVDKPFYLFYSILFLFLFQKAIVKVQPCRF